MLDSMDARARGASSTRAIGTLPMTRPRPTSHGTSTTATNATPRTCIVRSRRSNADRDRRQLFEKLAVVEDRHAERWEELFRAERPSVAGVLDGAAHPPPGVGREALRHSLMLPLMLAEEGREVQAYLGMARQSTHRQTHQAAVDIASDSAVHARELAEMMGREGRAVARRWFRRLSP